jgi:membrane protein implicated in regulation of membrane protease activity
MRLLLRTVVIAWARVLTLSALLMTTFALRTWTLLLTLTVIVRAAALILWRCLQQRTGADHQDTQPGNQTVRQFHVLLLKNSMQQKGVQSMNPEPLCLTT